MNSTETVTETPAQGASFTAALCTALHHTLPGWQLTEEPVSETAAAPALQFALTLEGGLTGQCFIEISEADAASLAGESAAAAPGDVLLAALRGAAEQAAQSFTGAGGVALHAELVDRVPDGLEATARLAAVSPGGSAALSLFLDPRLLAALPPSAVSQLPAEAEMPGSNLALVMDVELLVTLRFGQRQLALREVLDLTNGSVVELDRQVDEPVELLLGGKVIARGEAVIVDGNYGIRVTEVVQAVVL